MLKRLEIDLLVNNFKKHKFRMQDSLCDLGLVVIARPVIKLTGRDSV